MAESRQRIMEDEYVLSGREAEKRILEVALQVAARVQTTMGPLGRDKLLVDRHGNRMLTNDGANILKHTEFDSPIAAIIIDVAKAQEKLYYDGTTTCVVLVGELMRLADQLIEQGVHPNTIIDGYNMALQFCKSILPEYSESIYKSEEWDATESAIQAVKTTLTGKSAEVELEHLSNVCVEATKHAKPEDIKILKQHGEVIETEFIKGVVLQNLPVTNDMPKVVQGRVLCLDEEFAAPQANVTLNDPDKIQQILNNQEAYLSNRVDLIKELQVKFVVCQKGIDSKVRTKLAKAGILAVRNVRKSDMIQIAELCGATIVTDIGALESNDVGDAEATVSDMGYIVVESDKKQTATIIIRAPTEQGADELHRGLEDAVGVAYLTSKNPNLLPGAGQTQAFLHDRIRRTKWDAVWTSKQIAAANAFADALMIIPRTLAESAGLDTMETIVQLLREPGSYGVHAKGREVMSMNSVVEPMELVVGAMSGAVDAVTSLLRTDALYLARRLEVWEQGGFN
jgi:chaperonin GroEL (HSP60 family)